MGLFDKIFGGGNKKQGNTGGEEEKKAQERAEQDYELKEQGLENVLGKMHDVVGHAVIPFAAGGTVDMYYFSNHIAGTGFATMELLDENGSGPQPNEYGTYELVAFTRYPYNTNENRDTAFDTIERHICGLFTVIGNYASDAVLKPGDTCEVPGDNDDEYCCVVFDLYKPGNKEFNVGNRKHHLLLVIEIFNSEMEFARKNGSSLLFEKLKQAGHYPYSDLDREAVV